MRRCLLFACLLVLGACANGQRGENMQSGESQSTAPQQTVAATAPGEPPAGALSGAEVREAYSGHRYYGETPSGNVFILDYHEDGSMRGVAPRDVDNGEWWVDGDQLCRKWTRWQERKPEECFYVVRDGSNMRWYRNDGTLYRVWRE